MSLTRKMLKAMSIDDDKIDQIIDAHTETVNALKAERDQYREESERVSELEKQLKAAESKGADAEDLREKYDALKAEFNSYKNDQAAREVRASKEAAYRQLLLDSGISEKRIESIIRVSDLDTIELDSNGKLKGADKLAESVKTEWSDFVVNTTPKGANTPNPPQNTGASTFDTMSLSEKMAYANEHPNATEVTDWLHK